MSDNIGIRVGAAGNQAATVMQGMGGNYSFDQLIETYQALVAGFTAAMEDVQKNYENGPTQQAAAQVAQAFPGTQEATPAEAQAFYAQQGAPTPAPAPQPAQAAAPLPGVTDGDPQTAALWNEFFQDPSRWWDNRSDKRNPRAPDFKNKDDGDKALWIVGNKNPSWVADRLTQIGMS